MKFFKTIFTFCAVALVFFFSFSTHVKAEHSSLLLRLVANEWEPYTGDNVLNQGLSSDIVTTALGRAGYDTTIQIVPWTRALNGVQAGSYDGIIAAWWSQERAETMEFSTPYLQNTLTLFKRKDKDFTFDKFDDLYGTNIGTVRDYSYGEPFDSDKKLEKTPVIQLRTNIVRLAKGTIDLFPEDRFVVKHLLNTKYPEYFGEIDFIAKPLSERNLHFALSKQTPHAKKIIADFNKELYLMREEGLLDLIIQKHNLNF